MEMISLQMPDELLKTTRRCAKSLHVSRATYIRCAIERMNRQTQALLRAKRLAEAPMPFTLRPYRRFPVQCSATYNAGLFQGQGTVWNLSCTGWRSYTN